jgi:hypothetical protein
MVKFAQRYARSAQSSNLKDDVHNTDCEALQAVAFVSMKAGAELACLLFRVRYANDATSFKTLLSAWVLLVEKKAAIRHWPVHVVPHVIAKISLEHWLVDVCGVCEGRAYEVAPGTPMLSDTLCKACQGSGKKPLLVNRAVQDYIEDMLEELAVMERYAGNEATKKAADDFKFL